MGKLLTLRHPRYGGLHYGPNNDIIFGSRAHPPQPEYVARVDEDHPLLPALLAAYPEIVIGDEKAKPDVVYICKDHIEQEFRTKAALAAHLRSKAHNPNAEDGAVAMATVATG